MKAAAANKGKKTTGVQITSPLSPTATPPPNLYQHRMVTRSRKRNHQLD